MKKVLLALALLVALCLPSHAADQQFVYKNATLGTTSTVINFGFGAQSVFVQNRAVGPVLYVDWTGQPATALDFEVEGAAGASISGTVNANGGVLTFGAIAIACASATCSVQVLALR